MKLLVIEDEKDLGNALKKGFGKKGIAVDLAETGRDGLELYRINAYDVILLDLNLPEMDGLTVLKHIRAVDEKQRILILSARSSVSDRVMGLDMGANDYLSKPFDFQELDARVRSLMRCEILQHNTLLTCGKLTLDTKAKQVTVEGEALFFQPKAYAILEYLLLHRESVVSAETLIEHIWDSEVNFFTDSVKVHISNIRKKLKESDSGVTIETKRRQGYSICCEACAHGR